LPPLILNTDSFVAIVSSEGRLLITTTKEIPRLNKGKGSIIFKIPKNKRENNDEILTHLIELAENQSIKIIAGKRTLTLKPSDWQLFIGNKGARGQLLPRGFRNINNIELINKDD
jgi:topoisomerase-4 subunit A